MESLDFLSLGSSDQQEKLQKLHKQLCIEQAAWRKSSQGSQSGVNGVPVVYEWNFPKAGLRASRIMSQVVPIIAQTCSSDPKMVIHIVVPPCQPMFGKGEAMRDERAASIAQNIDRLWGELANPHNGLCVRKVVGLWDSDTFYSHDRDLGFEYWLVVSEFLPCQGCVQPHLWQLCFDEAWCFPNNDESNGEKGLRQLESSLWGLASRKHPTSGHESYQWFSGAQLFGAVLGELIKGSILTQNHVHGCCGCLPL